MNICKEIEKIILFGFTNQMIEPIDEILVRNRILEILDIEDYPEFSLEERKELLKEVESLEYPTQILDNITKWAGENGRLKEDILVFHDLLNSKIMGQILPRTSTITNEFWNRYSVDKNSATEYFYNLSKKSNYIRTDRISKNVSYNFESKYGNLEITINLSKPEKDPKEIALARNLSTSSYPKSLLCKENEGYMGRINYPGRQNHRILKLNLTNEDWFFQYSPYIYYNEHSIVFSGDIRSMKIDRSTFTRLIEFVEMFPHYFIGSNADLPIVGGSILSHDHFQAGRHKFAMETAKISSKVNFENYKEIEAGILNWPLSVIRLSAKKEYKEKLIDLADKILQEWIKYNDYENDISSHTNGIRHNTITPIARMKDDKIELDLVLRNNKTTEEFPLGIFHPHEQHHSIKKENIGLIEVMGLAVLPGRLKHELEELDQLFMSLRNVDEVLDVMKENTDLQKHINWVKENFTDDMLKDDYFLDGLIEKTVGKTFEKVLEDCGVFKNNEVGRKGFIYFLSKIK
ncbi:UDP-glucose--hexose-1-phosphate uridylyltransferase [Streptobacillus moniliformis]|uniref:UDP-glucose--hexose-1-phosphate uridylyltransferase n=1 Tax=Streptobacillus moniliformis TaxID=34105 RepID=UPI0007E47EE3|nr:UDP-glucose--hexose-1-phosphate uridylyltransferase [Streptobacillus moniliformis]